MTDLLSNERLEKIAALETLSLSDGTAIAINAYGAAKSIEIKQMAQELIQRREAADNPVYQVAYDGGWHDVEEPIYRQGVEDQRETRVVYLSAPLTSADWEKDSSLETWFPLTAERLAAYDRAAKEPVAWRCASGTLAERRLVTVNKPVADSWRDEGCKVVPLFTAAPLPVVPQTLLRELVDVVWQEAKESTEVPSTKWADELIGKVFSSATTQDAVAWRWFDGCGYNSTTDKSQACKCPNAV